MQLYERGIMWSRPYLRFMATLLFSIATCSAVMAATDRERRAAISAVLAAINRDDGAEVERLFRGDSGDFLKINQEISGGVTFLHYAAQRCAISSIASLLRVKDADANPQKSTPSRISPLTTAALACARDTPARATTAMQALVKAGAAPNPEYQVEANDPTAKEPEFFKFADLCNVDAAYLPGYLAVLSEWMNAGLVAASKATPARGAVSILHYWPGISKTPLCGDGIRLLLASAKPQDFEEKDSMSRLPVDYTLGAAVFYPLQDKYAINCFIYYGDAISAPVLSIRNMYRSGAGRPQPDIERACVDRDRDASSIPQFSTGIDVQNRPFLIQEKFLARITDSATTDNPGCQEPPGGWSRCGIMRFEALPPINLLTNPEVKFWRKAADGSCPKSFNPARHHSASDAGYKQCVGECGDWTAIYPETPKTISGQHYLYVEALIKNWSAHQDYCYAVTVHTGP